MSIFDLSVNVNNTAKVPIILSSLYICVFIISIYFFSVDNLLLYKTIIIYSRIGFSFLISNRRGF